MNRSSATLQELDIGQLQAKQAFAHKPGKRQFITSNLKDVFRTHGHHEAMIAGGFAAQRKPGGSLLLIGISTTGCRQLHSYLVCLSTQETRVTVPVRDRCIRTNL